MKTFITGLEFPKYALPEYPVYKHIRWFSEMALLRPLEKETDIEEKLSTPEKLLQEKKLEATIRPTSAQPTPNVFENVYNGSGVPKVCVAGVPRLLCRE